MPSGNVEVTILDGGAAVVVPSSKVQVVIGCSTAGTAAAIVATQSPDTLASNFTSGELPEAGALSALKGATIIAMKAATVTAGLVRGSDAATLAITSSTNATPIVVTAATSTLATGALVTISGHLVNTAANGTWKITKLTATTFSLDGSIGVGIGAATGTVQPLGSYQFGTGTSEITFTGAATDTFYIKAVIVTGGTIGTTGITFKVSLDAGRHYGPELSLGTATTYLISKTGITLNFSAGTLVAADYATAGTIGPLTDTAGVIACIDALKASQYGQNGFGSMHVLGPWTGADADTINDALDSMASNNYIYTRMICTARDASPPVIYGGSAETMTTYIAALATSYSAVDAKRVCANGGYYNMASAFPNVSAGAPTLRRPFSWSLAARQVQIPPQRHAGRVRDGAMPYISVDPTNDPQDGFLYYNNEVQSGLNEARFCCARTRNGYPGFYVVQPNLMSALGSVFDILPKGNVMDVACDIIQQVGAQEINEDLRTNANGTLYVNDALAIQSAMLGQIDAFMTSTKMISSADVVVNQSWNVKTTGIVKVAATINGVAYVLEMDVDVGYQNPLAAS